MGLTTWSSPNGQRFTIHRDAVPMVEPFFKRLHELHPDYQSLGGHAVRPMRTLDGRNLGGLSSHASGYTLDIKAPDPVLRQLAQEFPQVRWGGNFKSHYDPVHFEFKPGAAPIGAAPSTPGQGLTGAAPQMALYNPPQQQQQPQGFNVDNWVQNPLFLMGASVLGAPNIGSGLMQGAQAAQSSKLGGLKLAQYQDERADKQRVRDMWGTILQAGDSHPLLAGVPPELKQAVSTMDPETGLKTLQKYQMTKAMPEFGKGGTVFQGQDGNFYTVQFGADGTRRVDPLPTGMAPARGVQTVDQGDRTQIVSGATGQTIREVPKNVAAAEGQKVEGRETAELKFSMPKAKAALDGVAATQDIVKQTIEKALPNVGFWTSGMMGKITSFLPGTPARDLAEALVTIKGNIGFDKLQDMRANSPTGGALGQVAVQELETLQKVLGSLEQAQSPQQLRENLMQLQQTLAVFQRLREQAFANTYAPVTGAGQFAAPGLSGAALQGARQGAPQAAPIPSGSYVYDPNTRSVRPAQ